MGIELLGRLMLEVDDQNGFIDSRRRFARAGWPLTAYGPSATAAGITGARLPWTTSTISPLSIPCR